MSSSKMAAVNSSAKTSSSQQQSQSSRHTRSGHTSSTGSRTLNVAGKSLPLNEDINLSLTFLRVLGKGTFGCIEQAILQNSPEPVAVKKVFQDPRYKNRELNIFFKLGEHPNLVRLLYYFYTSTNTSTGTTTASNITFDADGSPKLSGSGEVYLHLVMECFPESLADLVVRYCRGGRKIAISNVRLYTYQMLRALGYLGVKNICHRDMKSSNLLVEESTGRVKLCDLGSAKEIVPGQTNVAYISSRYYRAPELIFGAEQYDCAIDMWSAGCVLAEMLLRKCLFMGSDSVDQLTEIIKVLGTPSVADVKVMNPKYSAYSFPKVPKCPLKLYLPRDTPADVTDLLSQMLVYRPDSRMKPYRALLHDAFQEVRSLATSTPPPAAYMSELCRFLPCELAAEPRLQEIAVKSDVGPVDMKPEH